MDPLGQYPITTPVAVPTNSELPHYDHSKSYISLGTHTSYIENISSQPPKSFQLSFNVVAPATEGCQQYSQSPCLEPFLETYPDILLPTASEDKNSRINNCLSSGNTTFEPKKRGRKPKSSRPSRYENKLNRNSNKPYVNYKGIEIESKEFIDYKCYCHKQCFVRLSSSERRSEFEKFWLLSAYDAQTAFIAAKVTEHPVKRRYGKSGNTKKEYSRTYSLCTTPVCRDMFCRTLQISSGRINTALTKIRTRTAIKDQRGVRKAKFKISKKAAHVKLDTDHVNNVLNSTKNVNQQKSYVENISTKNGHLYGHNNVISPVTSTCTNTGGTTFNLECGEKNIHSNIIIPEDAKDDVSHNIINIKQVAIIKQNDRPKKGRKAKYNQSRQENKTNRNNNKAYINYKGILVQPKEFMDFHCDCSKKCSVILTVSERSAEFEKFWALPYDSQTAYIVSAVSEQPVKKRYSQDSNTKKYFTRKYALGPVHVCREMFCRTLNISPGRINTALKKYRLKSNLGDQRGIKQGGHNKLPAEKRNCVIRFLKRIPVYKSHYCKDKNKPRFLPPDLTLAKLYDLYKEEEKDNAVSNASFKKIFYNFFNIRNKDTCQNCDWLNEKLRKEEDSDKIMEIKSKYNDHKTFVAAAQKYLEYDLLLAKKYTDVECITFGMERNLNIPRIPANLMYYKRLLWLYNLSIYSSKKDQSYCYVWSEGQAGKGAQEVGSCLLKHAKEEIVWSPDVCHLIVWTESYGGLTRNMKLTLIMKALLQSSPTLKTIKLKFLVSGHNSLPNQRDFIDIERTLKTQNHLYTTEDYMNLIRYSRKKKPIVVKPISNQEFFSTKDLEKQIPNIMCVENEIKWPEVHEISMFLQDPYTIYYKKDYIGETFSIDIRPHIGHQVVNFSQSLVPLWPLGKPITPSKLKDLKSVMHMIPSHAKDFYSNLQCGTNNDEEVDGFNDELDFELEINQKNL